VKADPRKGKVVFEIVT